MKVELTKCDVCGKQHPRQAAFFLIPTSEDKNLIHVSFPVPDSKIKPHGEWPRKHYDLCDLNCLCALIGNMTTLASHAKTTPESKPDNETTKTIIP